MSNYYRTICVTESHRFVFGVNLSQLGRRSSVSVSNHHGKMTKECLITTGATAEFPELIKAALSPECLHSFVENGFTRLNFQCGASISSFEDLKPSDTKGLDIHAFDFNKNGLNKEMRACQAKEGVSQKGLVICHAGRSFRCPQSDCHLHVNRCRNNPRWYEARTIIGGGP